MSRDRRWFVPLISTIVVALIALTIELNILPKIYSGIPLPFQQTSKPIGGVLFPATFLHLLLGYGGMLAILYSAKKAGFKVNGLLPSTKKGFVETTALLILLLSGVILWWFPPAMLTLIITGIYLVFSETR